VVRAGLISIACALSACSRPTPSDSFELISAERHGQLRFRLENRRPHRLEFDGYRVAGLFHLDWNSRKFNCADDASPGDVYSPPEPWVNGVFTGVKLRIEPGQSAEFIVDHMARTAAVDGICRLQVKLTDRKTLVVSEPFPLKRLRGS
jgi:hypothetical protein